jgi:hypothetical protein
VSADDNVPGVRESFAVQGPTVAPMESELQFITYRVGTVGDSRDTVRPPPRDSRDTVRDTPRDGPTPPPRDTRGLSASWDYTNASVKQSTGFPDVRGT